jgi:hypothetical protein
MMSDQQEKQVRTGLHNHLNKDRNEPAYPFAITFTGKPYFVITPHNQP